MIQPLRLGLRQQQRDVWRTSRGQQGLNSRPSLACCPLQVAKCSRRRPCSCCFGVWIQPEEAQRRQASRGGNLRPRLVSKMIAHLSCGCPVAEMPAWATAWPCDLEQSKFYTLTHHRREETEAEAQPGTGASWSSYCLGCCCRRPPCTHSHSSMHIVWRGSFPPQAYDPGNGRRCGEDKTGGQM